MRARKISTGDTIFEDIRKKNAKLIVICEDASANTIKKLSDKCQFYGVKYVYIDNSNRLNHAIGTYNRMAVAILEEGFAKKIETCLMKG